jgi:hypothetical protein
MIQDSCVTRDGFSRNEVNPLWNLSMMTCVDEINNQKHMNMNFSEFIEAICRVADKDNTDLDKDGMEAMIEVYKKRPLD